MLKAVQKKQKNIVLKIRKEVLKLQSLNVTYIESAVRKKEEEEEGEI
jgi:hypothetical protein